MAGPKLRAGLREAPEIGPSAQMTAAKMTPMLELPHANPEESGSVDPSTVIASIIVPTISARTAAKIGIGRELFGRVLPRYTPGIDAAEAPTIASSTTAPTVAPMNWATMYGGTLLRGSLPDEKTERVTAGLKCAPEMLPTEAMPATSATPNASPTNPRPSEGPAEKRAASFAMVIDVAPMNVSKNVP